jgi:hypothetical protein
MEEVSGAPKPRKVKSAVSFCLCLPIIFCGVG